MASTRPPVPAPARGGALERTWAWGRAAWWPWLEPEVLARLMRRALLLIGLGVALGFTTILLDGTGADADRAVLDGVASMHHDRLLTAAERTSYLASFTFVAVAAAVLALASRWRTGSWRLGQLVSVAVVGGLAVVGTVKLVVPRDRPDLAVFDAFSSAFPSGHAARAVLIAGVAGWYITRRGLRPSPAVVWTATVTLAAAVAGSRIYLGMHWPSDVIVGAALGAGWLAVVLPVADEHHLVHRVRPPDRG